MTIERLGEEVDIDQLSKSYGEFLAPYEKLEAKSVKLLEGYIGELDRKAKYDNNLGNWNYKIELLDQNIDPSTLPALIRDSVCNSPCFVIFERENGSVKLSFKNREADRTISSEIAIRKNTSLPREAGIFVLTFNDELIETTAEQTGFIDDPFNKSRHISMITSAILLSKVMDQLLLASYPVKTLEV